VYDNAGVATVKEFKRLVTRDKDRFKKLAFKELAYVYLTIDYRSPFFNEKEDRRIPLIKKELGLPDDWEPDEAVKEAIARYELLMETPIIRLLKKARLTIEKMEEYFDQVDFTERNDKTNALVFTPKEVLNAIAEIGDAHQGLDKLEDMIKKDRASKQRVQGGGTIGAFEL
jgi:hypothetical protein